MNRAKNKRIGRVVIEKKLQSLRIQDLTYEGEKSETIFINASESSERVRDSFN